MAQQPKDENHASKPAQQSEVIQGTVGGPLVIDVPAAASRARETETDALRAGQAQGIPKAPTEVGSEKAASKPLQIDEPEVLARARVGDAEVAALRSGQARGEKARTEDDPHRADPTARLNAILPVGPQRAPDNEREAELRAKAMASIDSGDKQADAKREIVDRMDGGELTRFLSGADRQAAEKVLRDAAARQERELMSAPVREANPPLAERFNITRKLFSLEYQFRDQPGKVAFTERFGHMRSESNSHAAVLGMVDRAAERGWSTIRVNGTGEFKRQAWIAAEARGIKTVGYEPTKGDQEAAKAERARLEAEQGARATQADRGPPAKHADAAQEVRPAPGAAQARSEDRHQPEQRDLQAEARAARQREEAVRSDPRASDAAMSAAKEDRKNADYQAWAGQPGALDRAQQREASQCGLLGDSKGAVLRAFDLAMERQGIAAPQQEALRKELGRQLDAVQATGRIPLVKVYDKNAPRVQAPAAPKVEHRRAHSERVR